MRQDELIFALESLLDGECDRVTILANAAALLFYELPELNWAGFYLSKRGCLALGPFQGRVACTRIAFDRGVCGAAFSENRTVRVEDVHAFSGHIACDSASRSELVVPLRHADGTPFGVLDLDSPRTGRFTQADAALLERAAALIEAAWNNGED